MSNYIILIQFQCMKEDSLLSSLSNVSYHAHQNSNDFFNDSSPAGGYPELKVKQPKQQQEVDLNQLPAFTHPQTLSPRNNGILMTYWTVGNHLLQGHSQNHSQYAGDSQLPNQEIPMIKIEQKVKLEQVSVKIEQPSDSISEERIGIVIKNQTKNIPKNYGKAIITYIQKERDNFQQVLKEHGIEYDQLLAELSKKKKSINTIANLRDLWVDFKYARCMRVLSNQFLRKYALQYIFNSRICNYTSHVKYRKRLQEAIQTPGSFRHIKQY